MGDEAVSRPDPVAPEPVDPDRLVIPSHYRESFKRGYAANPERARNYIVHTMVGDPVCDALMAQLEDVPLRDADRFIRAAIENPDDPALRDAPAVVHTFVEDLETVPDWVDYRDFTGGIRADYKLPDHVHSEESRWW